ncbi:NHLP-related RiPP peptide [Stenotrophomonas terrae]|uniref:NHLP-related RiPP peptide n=1 Tax=Stenotrophomonas terrae TaxID=405446 RepID=UPI0009F91C69|nr:NHLP-related RiPP peptide [Stenotrophomonas terrae]
MHLVMMGKSPLSFIDATKLMDLLTSDEGFRETFQRCPSEAMLRISPEAAAATSHCSMPGNIASIEVLSSTRDRMMESLTSSSIFSIAFCFVDGAPERKLAAVA